MNLGSALASALGALNTNRFSTFTVRCESSVLFDDGLAVKVTKWLYC